MINIQQNQVAGSADFQLAHGKIEIRLSNYLSQSFMEGTLNCRVGKCVDRKRQKRIYTQRSRKRLPAEYLQKGLMTSKNRNMRSTIKRAAAAIMIA